MKSYLFVYGQDGCDEALTRVVSLKPEELPALQLAWTDGGVFFFRNIDETNFVEIGITSDDTSGGTFYPFLKLLAGEYAVGRLSNATIFAKADTAAVNLQFRMLSP